MKPRPRGRLFVIVAVTVTWVIWVPAIPYFFVALVKWPLSFTLSLYIPILLVFVPNSYGLALAGNEFFGRSGSIEPSSRAINAYLKVGILTGVLCVLSVWLVSTYTASSYLAAAALALAASLTLWAAHRQFRIVIAELRIRTEAEHTAPSENPRV